MLHGPCGAPDHVSAPCMEKDATRLITAPSTTPRISVKKLTLVEDGYPQYARPNNGRTFTKRLSQSHTHVFTNHDVVPYNPYLLAKYDCHINVEISASVKAVKYIHKYVYKGHDRATVQIEMWMKSRTILMVTTLGLWRHAGISLSSPCIRSFLQSIAFLLSSKWTTSLLPRQWWPSRCPGSFLSQENTSDRVVQGQSGISCHSLSAPLSGLPSALCLRG